MMKLIIIVIGYIISIMHLPFCLKCTSHAFYFNILELGRETQLDEGCSVSDRSNQGVLQYSRSNV